MIARSVNDFVERTQGGLRPDLTATFVTHSPTALVDHPSVEVYVLGSRLFKHSAVTCEAATTQAAQTVQADVFLLGVTGVHPHAGLTQGSARPLRG